MDMNSLVTVSNYDTLNCFHTSFTAQLHMFPQNMYVLNRYANYPNGNQEAWPFQLASLFPFHFSCNTSQSSVMKHNVLWRLYVARSAAGNWMFLLPQTELTLHNRMILPTTHPLQRNQITQHRLFANAWFFCVSPTCWCWCNWNQHHVNWNTVSTRALPQ